jgi:hypothetical protein
MVQKWPTAMRTWIIRPEQPLFSTNRTQSTLIDIFTLNCENINDLKRLDEISTLFSCNWINQLTNRVNRRNWIPAISYWNRAKQCYGFTTLSFYCNEVKPLYSFPALSSCIRVKQLGWISTLPPFNWVKRLDNIPCYLLDNRISSCRTDMTFLTDSLEMTKTIILLVENPPMP